MDYTKKLQLTLWACLLGTVFCFAQKKKSQGDVFFFQYEYQKAVDAYEEEMSKGVITKEQFLNLADAYYDRGISFYELECFDESITDLTRAIDLNPDADHYYAQRSLAYLFTDRIDLAQADEDMCEEIRNRD